MATGAKEKVMIERVELLKEIDNLPSKYYAEVFDFVEFLQQKAKNQHEDEVDAYMEMAADTRREQEASEWCNAYFGPIPVK